MQIYLCFYFSVIKKTVVNVSARNSWRKSEKASIESMQGEKSKRKWLRRNNNWGPERDAESLKRVGLNVLA